MTRSASTIGKPIARGSRSPYEGPGWKERMPFIQCDSSANTEQWTVVDDQYTGDSLVRMLTDVVAWPGVLQ